MRATSDVHVALDAAKAYALKGDLGKARGVLRELLESHPDNEEARALLERLTKLEKRRK